VQIASCGIIWHDGHILGPRALARILTWNIERRAPETRQALIMMERIAALAPDVVCLTEAFEGSTAVLGGFEISVKGVSWSREASAERKVVLWSREPWTAVDLEGNSDLQCGAFAAATTTTPAGDIRVMGVCIPYHFASPFGVSTKARPWSQHLRFLMGLQRVVADRPRDHAAVVLGDFNQYVPRIWGSKAASAALDLALKDLVICTAGMIEVVDRPAIDHIALSSELLPSNRLGIDEHDEDGRKLSDHFGISLIVEMQSSICCVS
jgi:endonuclease/exonuclease/phosphatase family metal-dependent hydrolase